MIQNLRSISQVVYTVTPIAAGGTGLTTYAVGDILYADTASSLAKLGIGGANYVLGSDGTDPGWINTLTSITLASPTVSGTVSGTPTWASGQTMPSLVASSYISIGTNPASTGELRLKNRASALIRNEDNSADGGRFYIQHFKDVADSSLENLNVDVAASEGVVVVVINSSDEVAIFSLNGASNTTNEITDPSSAYSGTATTASSSNIYYSGGNSRYELDNYSGGTLSYTLFYFVGP